MRSLRSHGIAPRLSGRFPHWKAAAVLLGALSSGLSACTPQSQNHEGRVPAGIVWKLNEGKLISAVVCVAKQAQKVQGTWPELYSGNWQLERTTGGEQLGNVRISEDRKKIIAPSGDWLDCSTGKAYGKDGAEKVWYHDAPR